jgi:hypothetical protein
MTREKKRRRKGVRNHWRDFDRVASLRKKAPGTIIGASSQFILFNSWVYTAGTRTAKNLLEVPFGSGVVSRIAASLSALSLGI